MAAKLPRDILYQKFKWAWGGFTNTPSPLPTYVDVLDLTDVLILSYAGLDDISWLFRVRAPLLVEGHSQ